MIVYICMCICLESDVIMGWWNKLEKPTQSLKWTVWVSRLKDGVIWRSVSRYKDSSQERNRLWFHLRVQGAWVVTTAAGEAEVWETLTHTGGDSPEHSWHYSPLTNNPNFIQWAGPTEWLQCVEFTHWEGHSVPIQTLWCLRWDCQLILLSAIDKHLVS